MNEDMIKSAYDAMSPDEAARQRMLKRLMDKGGQKVKKEYSAQPEKSNGWFGSLAAILVLAVLAVGLVTMLNNRTPSQLSDDQTTEAAEGTLYFGQAVIEDFQKSSFYRAAMEYYDWTLAFSGEAPNSREKMAEFAAKYGLKSYDGDDWGTDSYDYFLETLTLETFLREDVTGVIWAVESCWYYDQERFNVAGTVAMNWEDSPRTVPVDFNFYRTTPDYLLPALGEMGHLEDYECWEYTLTTGETAILVRDAENAYVIVYRAEELWFLVVDNWKRDESDRTMTREALEAFAELFTYEMVHIIDLENHDPSEAIVSDRVLYPIQPVVDDNSTVAVALDGGPWIESDGTVFMNVIIYVYDQFDSAEIAELEVGKFIYLSGNTKEVTSLVREENGDILINGGAEELGYTLRTDGDGVYYEVSGTGTKCWQEYMVTTVPLSPDFQFSDFNGKCGLVYTVETFLEMEFVREFTPYNTTLVLKDGAAISMERVDAS